MSNTLQCSLTLRELLIQEASLLMFFFLTLPSQQLDPRPFCCCCFFFAVVCFLLMPEPFLVRTTRAVQFGSWQRFICLAFGLSRELLFSFPFFSCPPQTLQTHLWCEHKIEPLIIHNSGDILGKQEANCN